MNTNKTNFERPTSNVEHRTSGVQRWTLDVGRWTFALSLVLSSFCSAQSTQPISDAAAIADVTALYNAGLAAVNQLAVCNSQLAAADRSIADLELQIAGQEGRVHNAAGAATAFTLPDNASLNGDSFTGAKFNAAQKYACIVGSGSIVTGVSSSSDSGGIDVRGTGSVLNGTITSGNGQNGLSGGAAKNCIINNCTSSGNNVASYDVLNEAGGGKWMSCSGCVFNNCTFINNKGVGLWFDGSGTSPTTHCTVNGGTFSNNAPADGKTQVACVRIELCNGIALNGIASVVSGGMHTCVEICDANHITIEGCSITGQIGWDKTARAGALPVSDISILGNTIRGSIWDSGLAAPNCTIEGNTFIVPKGQPIGYLHGKTQYTIADMQAIGFEKSGLGKVVNP
jgi:hypothetical protein